MFKLIMDTVYIFPLNQSLTLKKVPLPFHIFEPKYKSMLADAIKNNKRITVIPTLEDYSDFVCISGIPIVLQKYEDGRLDIVITGVEKIQLKHEKKSQPFYEYYYEPISENNKIINHDDYSLVKELVWSKISKQAHFKSQKDQFVKIFQDQETVINYAILLLVIDIDQRVMLMQLPSIDKKIETIINLLAPEEIKMNDLYSFGDRNEDIN